MTALLNVLNTKSSEMSITNLQYSFWVVLGHEIFHLVSQGRTNKNKFDTYVLNFFFALPDGGGVRRPPHYATEFPMQTTHSKCYIVKGQGGVYIADTQPLAAQQQPAHRIRTAQSNGEKEREQERVVTMSTASSGTAPVLQPSFDKTGWPQSVGGKTADGEDFICSCGANFGDGSGMDEGQAIAHECLAQHRE